MISRRYLRIKTFQALYAYFHSGSDNQQKIEKDLFHSFERMHDLYLLFLTIGDELIHYSKLKNEEAKQKRLPSAEDLNPNTKFIDNAVFNILSENIQLKTAINNKKLLWNNDQELLVKLMNFMRKHPVYEEYMSTRSSSFEED